MNLQATMHPAWFIYFLSVYIIAGVSAFQSILVANDDGVLIADPDSKENKTVLPFFGGANSVGYNLETGYIYSIVKTNVPAAYRIVRTKVVETPDTNVCNKVENWCKINQLCINVCNSSNPFIPKLVLTPYKCSKANNLVLDWINNNMYWTCEPTAQFGPTLNRATLEGSDNITILTGTKPFLSVEIDPFKGRLFYLESKPFTLKSSTLDGGNVIDNYHQFDEVALKISLDTQRQTVYVVGHTSSNEDETFLASLNYGLTEFKKLYKSKDPAWRFGPKIATSVLYWLTMSSNTEWESFTQEDVEMKRIVMPYKKLNQWGLVHLEAQKPSEGSICSKRGCSHNCSHSKWMKITCQCPPGMELREDNKNCYIPATEAPIKSLKVSDNGKSLGDEEKAKPGRDSEEKKGSNKPESIDPSTYVSSATGNTTGELEVVSPGSEIDSTVQSSGNGTDLAKSAVGASRNATEAVGAVTASSNNMTLFYVVVITIFVSAFVVVVVVKRRAKTGNYQPAGSGERTDFSL